MRQPDGSPPRAMTPREIADAIWLSQFLERSAGVPADDPGAPGAPDGSQRHGHSGPSLPPGPAPQMKGE